MKVTLQRLGLFALLAGLLLSCRKEKVVPEPASFLAANGVYLLNEGNWGSNKCSLDFYSFANGAYQKDVFKSVNPEVTLGLGDVGNDMKAYGSRLYLVVNGSNKLEVINLRTAKRIGTVYIPNCRNIAFYKNKAYVTSYDGYVAVIDTAVLTVGARVNVGRQPEELVVVGEKLYVANSGGYTLTNLDRTVSVIDLTTGTKVKDIDVAINLHRLKVDSYGDLYVTSRGDYEQVGANIYVVDTQTDVVKKKFDIPASNLVIHKDMAYIYSSGWSNSTGGYMISYNKINVKDETVLPGGFISDGTQANIMMPYGIEVEPTTEDIYITDAKDYMTPGKLYCYTSSGKLKWSVDTGDIPGHIVFVK